MTEQATPLEIPDEAWVAVARACPDVDQNPAKWSGWDINEFQQKAVEAAAPLIAAAELDAQATRIEDSAKAWREDLKPGTPAYSMAGVLADVVVELRLRALELRGDRKAAQP